MMKDFVAIAHCHSSKVSMMKDFAAIAHCHSSKVYMMKDFAAIARSHSSKCTSWHFVPILPIVVNICKALGQNL